MSQVEAGTRWRRLLIYYQSPGSRQGTILAPVMAWRRLPGSSGTWPLDFWFVLRPRGRRKRQASRTNRRTIRAHDRADEMATPGHCQADHGDHGGHGRPRQDTTVTAVTAGNGGHGLSRPNISDAGSRPRRHEPGAHGPGQGAHTPSRHDLSTAVTAILTEAAAVPGSRPGVPGAAPTRSSARWVNGESGLRCRIGFRRGRGGGDC